MKFSRAVPILRVADPALARAFYCDRLGFRIASEYALSDAGPAYLTLHRDGAWLHLSSFPGDGEKASVVYIDVDDIEALQAQLLASGVEGDLAIKEQSWAQREIYLVDPDGNRLRFGARR